MLTLMLTTLEFGLQSHLQLYSICPHSPTLYFLPSNNCKKIHIYLPFVYCICIFRTMIISQSYANKVQLEITTIEPNGPFHNLHTFLHSHIHLIYSFLLDFQDLKPNRETWRVEPTFPIQSGGQVNIYLLNYFLRKIWKVQSSCCVRYGKHTVEHLHIL